MPESFSRSWAFSDALLDYFLLSDYSCRLWSLDPNLERYPGILIWRPAAGYVELIAMRFRDLLLSSRIELIFDLAQTKTTLKIGM